jgi:hypothetical protein
MSGSIAAAAVGVADLAVSLFGAGNQAVSLGSFVFAGYEVPERITWGGHQSLSVKKLVGGQRVIDAMGRDDSDIAWSGIFLSADASQRADQLDKLRVGGQQQKLIFSGRSYTVVIRSFRADQRKTNHVPYSIVCTILQDMTSAQQASKPTLLSQVTDDLNSALGFNVPAALQSAQSALQTVTPIVTPLVSLVGGTSASIAVATGLGGATALISSASSLAAGQLSGITSAAASVGNLLGAATPSAAIAAMKTAAAATQTAAVAAAMSGYVGRAIANVKNG